MTLSGIQHFAFCRRQWALIFIERQWADNVRTADGTIAHRRAHDGPRVEARGDMLIVRGLRVASQRLHVGGVCDVVEFHRSENGVPLAGREGRWQPYPVEYKKGTAKTQAADELQLCGQALCLEEMLACDIPEGSLFYGETRRRERVTFTAEMREKVASMLEEMSALFERGYTPSVKPHKGCGACSLKALCLPRLPKSPGVARYIRQRMEEDASCDDC